MGTEAIAVAAAVALLLAVFLGTLWGLEKRKLHARLTRYTGEVGPDPASLRRNLMEVVAGFLKSLAQGLSVFGRLVPIGEKQSREIERKLGLAGVRAQEMVYLMIGLKVFGFLGGAAAGFLALDPATPTEWAVAALVMLFSGVFCNILPEWGLHWFAQARLRRIGRALPDAFDLITVCVESGTSVERAIEQTALSIQAFHRDLADEFMAGVLLPMRLRGEPLGSSLSQLADRVPVQGLRNFATTISQSQRTGAPVGLVMKRLAQTERTEALAAIQERMNRLPVLLTFPMLGFILPGMMVLVAGPIVVRLFAEIGSAVGGG